MPLKPEQYRPTAQMVEAMIASETYTVLPSGAQIVCELTLQCGFRCTGISSLVDSRFYSEELGRKYAREAAFRQAWEIAAYETFLAMQRDLANTGEYNPAEHELARLYADFEYLMMRAATEGEGVARRLAAESRQKIVQAARASGFTSFFGSLLPEHRSESDQ